MSRFEKLKLGTRNIKNIKYPGSAEDVTLKILSNADIQDAIFATERFFKATDMTVSSTTLDAYEDERTTQILFRALRDPDDPKKPFAPSADELRKQMSKDEKTLLSGEYTAFEQECSPSLEKMTEEEFDALWEEVKKKPQIQLNSLNLGTQIRLLRYLASRPSTSPTHSGSTS
jgi:hypothetical protein